MRPPITWSEHLPMFYPPLPADKLRRLHHALEEFRKLFGEKAFYGDHLVALDRSLAFLRDEKFTSAVADECRSVAERSMIWRFHVLAWAADQAQYLDGDFVECGVYQGVSSRIVARYLDFARLDKRWFLYDLFDNMGGEGQGIRMPDHGTELVARVRQSFADFANIIIVQGRVPGSFAQAMPDRIAYFHLDLNDDAAERAALAELFPRMVPGALLVLDDYGWASYRAQQESADAFLAQWNYRVLELPTGQGLVVKR